jgi:hypothetical protein
MTGKQALGQSHFSLSLHTFNLVIAVGVAYLPVIACLEQEERMSQWRCD